MKNEPIEVTLKVTNVLERLGYLKKWAIDLKIADLLNRALSESA